jgi:hypothetical protein
MTTSHDSMTGAIDDPTSWFARIPYAGNPWLNWFAALDLPKGFHPLEASIEHDIWDLCRSADERRLGTVPRTERFAAMWATFRKHLRSWTSAESIAVTA